LYRAYRQIADGPEYPRLDPAQRKVIDNALRDFRCPASPCRPNNATRYKVISRNWRN
jgi:oligopeptidase A